jgi:FkbM family methyltransferase
MPPDLGIAIGDRIGRTGTIVRAVQPAYAWWLRAVYGRRGLPWHVNGEPIRIDPTVRHLVPQQVERPLFDYLRANIQPGDVVLDIGAFIGAYAILEARWAGPDGRVVAFEPSPESFATLQRHLRMNGLAVPRVEARQLAVGSRQEQRGLRTFGDEPYRNMIDAVGSHQSVVVDVVTLDDVCAPMDRPPTWIRMDVQGLEFDVLGGARDLLRERRGRLRIVAEMHPQHWPDYGIDPRDAAARLAALGLQARNVVAGEDPFGYDAHAILEPLE